MGGDVATWYVAFEARGGWVMVWQGGVVMWRRGTSCLKRGGEWVVMVQLVFEAREEGGGGEQDHNLIKYVENCVLE